MNPRPRHTLFALLIVLFVTGCADKPPESEPVLPDHQTSGSIGGSQTLVEPFDIPPNTSSLTIAASYSIGGTGRVDVLDPTGRVQYTKSYNGGANENNPTWFQMDDPPAGEWRLRFQVEGGLVYDFEMVWDEAPPAAAPVVDAAQSESNIPVDVQTAQWIAIGTGVGVGAIGVAFLLTEFGRVKALSSLAALGLFSRLEKDEVLAHEKREQVYQFIKDNPGPSFSDLLRELEISNGTLVHHLRILEMQEFIKPHRDGFRTRFYLRGPKVVPTAYLTRTQQQILDAIAAQPGVTQKELANVLRIPREAVSYHTKRLAAAGQLQVRQEGKWRRYWRVGQSVAALQPTAQPA